MDDDETITGVLVIRSEYEYVLSVVETMISMITSWRIKKKELFK